MSFGKRLRYFRTKRGLTQKTLGRILGFSESSADIRVAQYESGARYPKEKVIEDLACALNVHPQALTLPDIDNPIGLLHTFFALEDMYGIRIFSVEGEPLLFVDKTDSVDAEQLHGMLLTWSEQAKKLENGEISKEDYDRWRYRYPELSVPSKESQLMKNCPNFECLEQNEEICKLHPGCEDCKNADKCEVCDNQAKLIDGTPLPCHLIDLPICCRFCEIRNSDEFDPDNCLTCGQREGRNPPRTLRLP